MRPDPADHHAPTTATERDECPRIERELGVLLRRRMRLLALSGLDGRTIDGTGYAVLRRLSENGPLRLTTLAHLVGLDTSTVSRQVASLTADGLVERQRDPDDGRAYLLAPTPAGRDQLEQARDARCAVLRRLLGGWGADDRAALAELLVRLNDALDELAPAATEPDDSACPSRDDERVSLSESA